MRERICRGLKQAPTPIQEMMAQIYMANSSRENVTVEVGSRAYIAEKERTGVWGTDVEILQLSSIMECPIIVVEHPCEGKFQIRACFGETHCNPPQFMCRINIDRPEVAHYVFLVPLMYQPQIEAALALVRDHPYRVRLEYGPETLEFLCFGVPGDGCCLFHVGELMRLSASKEYQPGGASFSKVWTRILPPAPPVTDLLQSFRYHWNKGFIKSLRELAITSPEGHAYGETGITYLVRLYEARKLHDLEPANAIALDLGAGVGAFTLGNAAATNNPSIGLEENPNVHGTYSKIMESLKSEGIHLPAAIALCDAEMLSKKDFEGFITNVLLYDGYPESEGTPLRKSHVAMVEKLVSCSNVWSIHSTKLTPGLMSRYATECPEIGEYLK
jgi:hypothetical protein